MISNLIFRIVIQVLLIYSLKLSSMQTDCPQIDTWVEILFLSIYVIILDDDSCYPTPTRAEKHTRASSFSGKFNDEKMSVRRRVSSNICTRRMYTTRVILIGARVGDASSSLSCCIVFRLCSRHPYET